MDALVPVGFVNLGTEFCDPGLQFLGRVKYVEFFTRDVDGTPSFRGSRFVFGGTETSSAPSFVLLGTADEHLLGIGRESIALTRRIPALHADGEEFRDVLGSRE